MGVGAAYSSVAPARTSATPSLTRTVRRVSPVLMLPSNPEEADRTPVPAPRRALVVLDELDGMPLRCPGDGDSPGVGEEAVERVVTFAQPPLDMVDGVDQPRVNLDLAVPDHSHAVCLAHPRLVVAVDVRAHGELGLRLLRSSAAFESGAHPRSHRWHRARWYPRWDRSRRAGPRPACTSPAMRRRDTPAPRGASGRRRGRGCVPADAGRASEGRVPHKARRTSGSARPRRDRCGGTHRWRSARSPHTPRESDRNLARPYRPPRTGFVRRHARVRRCPCRPPRTRIDYRVANPPRWSTIRRSSGRKSTRLRSLSSRTIASRIGSNWKASS